MCLRMQVWSPGIHSLAYPYKRNEDANCNVAKVCTDKIAGKECEPPATPVAYSP